MNIKHIITSTLILFMLAAVVGCGSDRYKLYSTRSLEVSKENKSLKRHFEETRAVIQLKRDQFTDEEWRKVINTNSTINLLIEKYDAIAILNSSEVSVADLEFLWQLSTTGFSQAREVVLNKLYLLDPSTQVMLSSFDARVNEIDTEMASLLARPSEENVNKALILVSGTLSYAARMLGIVATDL